MPHLLSKLETNDFKNLERIIESGLRTFEDVGNALASIREKKLYRAEHDTFEAYCKQRWGFSSSRARQLVAAAEVVKEFPQVSNERQARVVAEADAGGKFHPGVLELVDRAGDGGDFADLDACDRGAVAPVDPAGWEVEQEIKPSLAAD